MLQEITRRFTTPFKIGSCTSSGRSLAEKMAVAVDGLTRFVIMPPASMV